MFATIMASAAVSISSTPPAASLPKKFRKAEFAPLLFIRCRPSCSVSSQALAARSEEHTSELQSLMRISYAVFCLKKKKKHKKTIRKSKKLHDVHTTTIDGITNKNS